MVPVNPFSKPLNDLTIEDLHKLVHLGVAEGYYIEYKRHFPPNKSKVGHSIASLANSFGGWYIVGIEENNHVASKITGIDLRQVPDPIATVRTIVKDHISPVPLFKPRLIPLQEDANRVVLIVYVPDGQETPFISKDGRIYRRVNDSSEPVPEADRYVVDRLYDKGRELTRRFGEFCIDQYDPGREAATGKFGLLRIFISPHPLGTVEKYDFLTSTGLEQLLERSRTPVRIPLFDPVEFEELNTLLQKEQNNGPLSALETHLLAVLDEIKDEVPALRDQLFPGAMLPPSMPVSYPLPLLPFTYVSGKLPFNTAQPTPFSVILRQVIPGESPLNSITAELFHDGRGKFFIPIAPITLERDPSSSGTADPFERFVQQLESRKVKELLTNGGRDLGLRTDGTGAESLLPTRLFDLGKLDLLIACLLSYYSEWLGPDAWIPQMRCAIKISGMRGWVPFADLDAWAATAQQFGPPTINADHLSIPNPLAGGVPIDEWAQRQLWQAVTGMIALACGLTLNLHGQFLLSSLIREAFKTSTEGDAAPSASTC